MDSSPSARLMELVAQYGKRFRHGLPMALELPIEQEIKLIEKAFATSVPTSGLKESGEFNVVRRPR